MKLYFSFSISGILNLTNFQYFQNGGDHPEIAQLVELNNNIKQQALTQNGVIVNQF